MISALKLCTDINIPVISESCTTITLIANTYTTSKKEKYKQTIVCLILLFLSLLNYCKKKMHKNANISVKKIQLKSIQSYKSKPSSFKLFLSLGGELTWTKQNLKWEIVTSLLHTEVLGTPTVFFIFHPVTFTSAAIQNPRRLSVYGCELKSEVVERTFKKKTQTVLICLC